MEGYSEEILNWMNRKGLESTISDLADAEMKILTIVIMAYQDIDIRERAIDVGYTLAAAIKTVESTVEDLRNSEFNRLYDRTKADN